MASRPKHTEPRPAPRLYLVTPRLDDTTGFAAPLAEALAAGDVAAVLLRLAEADERTLINRAKSIAAVVQAKGAALILDGHAELVARAGADGAHFSGIEGFGKAAERLQPDRIAGVGGLITRHDAMVAAEVGADYVMFGIPDETGGRPPFADVEERVAWWAELFESPCVGFAGAPEDIAPLVAAGADFIALGDWIWGDPRGAAAVIAAATPDLHLPETSP